MSAFRTEVPLRWVDQDAQGHVNNALVADYMQEARTEFLLSGPAAHLMQRGCFVASHQVEFTRPITFETTPITVDVVVGHVGAAQVTIGYELRQRDELVARARSVLAIVDPATGKPRRMAAGDRDWFAGQSVVLDPFRDLGTWTVGEQAYEAPFRVRWSDMDAFNHVDNVRAFDMIAEARIRMNPGDETHTRMEAAAAQGLTWLVVRQDIDYRLPILFRLDPYRVRTAYARVGRTSMTLAAQVEDPATGATHIRSLTVLVCADAAGRPMPLPANVAAGIDRWPAVRVR